MLEYMKKQGTAPQWMDVEGFELIKKYMGYKETTPSDVYHRLAKKAADYLGEDFYSPLYQCFWSGYLSPATPVATSYGAFYMDDDGKVKPRGLPVSCFGLKPSNSIDGIYSTAHEAAMLSKNGGGLGINISDLVGGSPVTAWAKLYDLTAKIVSQSGIRRGAVGLYLSIDHPDIEAFLHAKAMLEGDSREKLDCNIAVIIPDSFIERLKEGDSVARKLFAKVLELRMKQGSPYLFFVDNANRQKGIDYENLGLDINTSQLCNEISLYCDHEHTFVCVLSSLVASRYHNWRHRGWVIDGVEWSVPMLGIAFLDAVTEEFIQLGTGMPMLENAIRFAVKSRAVGLGLLGWHTFLQNQLIPFDSEDAYTYNFEIWSFIKEEAVTASKYLARKFGVPEWCEASQQRNTHLLAVAPTLANSVLSSAGSPSVEPIASNEYIYAGANGNYLRKNNQLQGCLKDLDLDTPEVWASITDNSGSIQHLKDVLMEKSNNPYYVDLILEVFKTAYEINQEAIIKQAAQRQEMICQGQSINLFLPHDTDAQVVANLHIQAWKQGLKGLYYIRSTSPRTKPVTLEADRMVNNWHIETKESCPFCAKAKNLLKQQGLSYTELTELDLGNQPASKNLTYPRIWVNGEFIGGYEELVSYLGLDMATESSSIEAVQCSLNPEDECLSCQG